MATSILFKGEDGDSRNGRGIIGEYAPQGVKPVQMLNQSVESGIMGRSGDYFKVVGAETWCRNFGLEASPLR